MEIKNKNKYNERGKVMDVGMGRIISATYQCSKSIEESGL